jgi:glycyl-tRNA synthetase beta chain
MRGAGVGHEALELREERKGRFWFATVVREGRGAAEIVAEVLERTVRGFPWPKSMRWGAGELRWVRPLHSMLCILSREDGVEIVPLEVDGIRAGATTWGHRFMAPGEIHVSGYEDYAAKLKRAHVVLDASERMDRIRADAESLAFASGAELVADEGLLAEVAGLVEWPVVLMGRIDEAYLHLPAEVLQTSMREHQKFFSVREGGRITRFVTVANRETADDGATILVGNARVLSARLADAAFFWENDLRVARAGMGAWLEKLGNVTFHAKLGSQAERIERIAALARELAPAVGADPDEAERAARLAKADLASEMVYEFPELQGVMGRYYALEAGEPEAVADAARDHYAPLGPSDAVPTASVSVAVALADKLDLLTGMWAIGETPTGSKDPFALRRAALGVIRIAVQQDLSFRVGAAVECASLNAIKHLKGGEGLWLFRWLAENELMTERNERRKQYESFGSFPWAGFEDHWFRPIQFRVFEGDLYRSGGYQAVVMVDPMSLDDGRVDFSGAQEAQWQTVVPEMETLKSSLVSFLHDRLKVHLRDEGIPHDVIDACLAAPRSDDLALLVARARALAAFLATPDGGNLVQGYKRAANILAQAEEKDGVEYSFGAEPKLAEEGAERALFDALAAARPGIEGALEREDFAAAMTELASLRAPIDAFFEAVVVNADSASIRRNRLNLLHEITAACERVADLSKVER